MEGNGVADKLARLKGSMHVQDITYFVESPPHVASYLLYNVIGRTKPRLIKDRTERSVDSGYTIYIYIYMLSLHFDTCVLCLLM